LAKLNFSWQASLSLSTYSRSSLKKELKAVVPVKENSIDQSNPWLARELYKLFDLVEKLPSGKVT